MKKALILLCLAASTAFAETDYSTWMRMKTADNKSTSYTRANWLYPDDLEGTPITAADSTIKNFYANFNLETPGATSTFPGEKLAITKTFSMTTASATHTVADLILLDGSTLKTSANVTHKGKTTVCGTVRYTTSTYLFRTWYINADFYSDADAVLNFGNNDASKTREYLLEGTSKETVQVNGNWSNFAGTLNLTQGTYYDFPAAFSGLSGTLAVAGNAYVNFAKKTSGEITLGGLRLEDASELMLDASKGSTVNFVISEALEIIGNPILTIKGTLTPKFLTFIDLFRLEGDAAANPPDVSGVIVHMDATAGFPNDVKLSVVDGDNGAKLVRVVPAHETAYIIKTGESFKPTGADLWRDGIVPSTDFDGDICVTNGVTVQFMDWANYNWPEATLYAQSIELKCYGVKFKKIVLRPNSGTSKILSSAGPDWSRGYVNSVNCPLEIVGGTFAVSGWWNHCIGFEGPISGTGTISASCSAQSGSSGLCSKYRADNTGFTGKFSLAGYNHDLSTVPANYFEFKNGDSLGGDYDGDDGWKAIALTDYAYLKFTESSTLARPTRGLYFNGGAVFEVGSGKSLTISSPMTYAGEFVKNGAGSLVLGNAAPLFAESDVQQDTPVENKNRLTISAGSLEIVAAEAVNGLAVSFAEGTSLVVDPNATGDLLANGAVNVKWATPFATTAASGKIPVVFKSENAPIEGASVAICTVTDTAAANLDFDVPENLGTRTVTTRWRPNDDGTQTFVADISARKGLFIIFQ